MAARPSVAARNLSLMEELEKLEQTITLTLQEIDHNFSKSHRIVTSSIIPVVEKYGEHSRAIWEASKFWKQFFEASANVSLSGYEELANDDETTVMEDSTAMGEGTSASYGGDATATPGREDTVRSTAESFLDDAELSGSTPRVPTGRRASPAKPTHDDDDDTTVLKEDSDEDEQDSTLLFAQRTAQLPDMTPRGKDPLLHRVLDKNYRVQATPHKAIAKPSWRDEDELNSSPEMVAPTLRSEVFMSPYKLKQRAAAAKPKPRPPRTPGVSVRDQTPSSKRRRVSGAQQSAGKQRDEIDWESGDDSDLYAGISPPKTIQFALPPSKLLQTPAREASRRIVDDILADAGEEYSPTMVKPNEDLLDDSF